MHHTAIRDDVAMLLHNWCAARQERRRPPTSVGNRRPCRARWSGHRLEADLDISVERALTVEEGRTIADAVHRTLVGAVAHLDRATVHVAPAGGA